MYVNKTFSDIMGYIEGLGEKRYKPIMLECDTLDHKYIGAKGNEWLVLNVVDVKKDIRYELASGLDIYVWAKVCWNDKGESTFTQMKQYEKWHGILFLIPLCTC